ncbi:hypothetical protein AB0O14_01420 [Microbacterium foliorum]
MADLLPPRPSTPPTLTDDFSRGLDAEKWVPHYLPHWTLPERSEARFAFVEGGLELRIEHDQLDWRPEDAPLRVSNLQTATYSGPVGSTAGTHRHRDDGLVVETHTPQRLLFTPRRGRIDLTVAASADEGCMLAAWLVGTEHLSETDAGEICIFEIDASAIGSTTQARTGVKSHHDTRLTTDMAEVTLPFDARVPHIWTVIWGEDETIIGCEGRVVRRLGQAPDYPLVLMIDLFEIGGPIGAYPKTAVIGEVTAWD